MRYVQIQEGQATELFCLEEPWHPFAAVSAELEEELPLFLSTSFSTTKGITQASQRAHVQNLFPNIHTLVWPDTARKLTCTAPQMRLSGSRFCSALNLQLLLLYDLFQIRIKQFP